MNTINPHCPYVVGESVIYAPSSKGLGYALPDEHLIPGQTYIIESIVDDRYLVVVGYNSVGGGIYWTEFRPPAGASVRRAGE